MDIFIKVSQFILSLSLLIVLHELGHFIPAKLFKTKVEKFYLFFDYKFSLFKKKIGETTYGIGWIPLGGYVKIAGMIDESMDTEQMKQEPKPWEFRSKPAWQRLIIMLGGVTVNFLLGIFIYTMILNVWGEDYVSTIGVKNGFSVAKEFEQYGFKNGDRILKINGEVPFNVLDVNKHLFLRDVATIEVKHVDGSTENITLPEDIGLRMWANGTMEPFNPGINAVLDSIIPDSPALKAGFQKNDKIISIDGKQIQFWRQFTDVVQENKERKEMVLVVLRSGSKETVNVTPGADGNLGVYVKNTPSEQVTVNHKDYTFLESIPEGTSSAYWTLRDYIAQFKYVFTKKGATALGGFGTILSIFPTQWDWQRFWSLTAFLSIMLAFMNLLPIPALDGGHVVFTLYEMISGRKPSDKFLEHAQVAGFIFLITLLLYANGNDVYKWITGKF
ncbi:MAG: RIP metalloprotease RseP [Flavobacteriaceae bacterium]|nr:RIP metalloprotease RseP [Flavobacteriaceae bacterium]